MTLRDIRELAGEPDAYAAELRRRWGGLQGVCSHVMFAARGKAGPFRIEAEPLAGAQGTVAVRTVMHDEGADDRVITVGSYVFRQVEDK
jgi:hypothetical protein